MPRRNNTSNQVVRGEEPLLLTRIKVMVRKKNGIDIAMSMDDSETVDSDLLKKIAKAEAENGYFFSSSLEERLKYQALLSNLTINDSELTAEFKFMCELVSLDKNAYLQVSSIVQINKLMALVFNTKWLKNRVIPISKKSIKDTGTNNTLIQQYVNERLLRLQQPFGVITKNEAKNETTSQHEEVNTSAFILNSILRDDFSQWVINTNATEQLALMGGSISSSSSWFHSLPTKLVNCIQFNYGYTVVKKKREGANGLMGIKLINFIPRLHGVQDPTYSFFSGEIFTCSATSSEAIPL